MSAKRILFISGSLGMGHITRDLAIAKAIRQSIPDVQFFWLAAHPANMVLKAEGEFLLPEPYLWQDETVAAEQASAGFSMNLIKYSFNVKKAWKRHLKVFKELMANEHFDLIIGDETYEIAIDIMAKKLTLDVPYVMIYDFIGTVSMSCNPIEKLGVYLNNRKWTRNHDCLPSFLTNLFVGEAEDVPDKPFGHGMPSRRDWLQRNCKIIGYILRFQPDDFKDRKAIRAQLGYEDGPLIVCSIGGTAIGKNMLELCGQAYPLLKERLPDLQMVLVCGPRLDPELLNVPAGVQVRGYVHELYKHFAACDLAIVQGGGTTTVELTALRVPFLYFPIERQFAQELYVAQRLARHRAGVKMAFSQTTPRILAETVLKTMRSKVDYAQIPVDGDRRAARIVRKLLGFAGSSKKTATLPGQQIINNQQR